MTDRKAVPKNADMNEEMQQDAVDCNINSYLNIEYIQDNPIKIYL